MKLLFVGLIFILVVALKAENKCTIFPPWVNAIDEAKNMNAKDHFCRRNFTFGDVEFFHNNLASVIGKKVETPNKYKYTAVCIESTLYDFLAYYGPIHPEESAKISCIEDDSEGGYKIFVSQGTRVRFDLEKDGTLVEKSLFEIPKMYNPYIQKPTNLENHFVKVTKSTKTDDDVKNFCVYVDEYRFVEPEGEHKVRPVKEVCAEKLKEADSCEKLVGLIGYMHHYASSPIKKESKC